MAGKDRLRPGGNVTREWPPNGHLRTQNRAGFWPGTEASRKCFRAGLYARVSTNDQQTIPLQMRALRDYAARRGRAVAMAGSRDRLRRLGAGTPREDRRGGAPPPDRRGAGVAAGSLGPVGDGPAGKPWQELERLGVSFVSLTEALDLTTPAGPRHGRLLAVFAEFEREILRERVACGAGPRLHNGKRLGRPATAAAHAEEVRQLFPGRASAKPRSPAASGSGAPRCAAFSKPRNPDHANQTEEFD